MTKKKNKNEHTLEELKQNHPAYYEVVKDILNHEEFQKRSHYRHHGDISVLEHSINVSMRSYYIAEKLQLDKECAAIGGLLHDFYSSPWQEKAQSDLEQKKKLLQKHGFVHAREALNNAKIFFPTMVDKKTANIIVRHMFPLNITPPRYPESWVVTIADKYISCEVFKHPKELYRYIGLRKRDAK